MIALQRPVAFVMLALTSGACTGHHGELDGVVRSAGKAPSMLITTFWSAERELGVEAAEEVRSRLSRQHSARELFVYPKSVVDSTLKSLGHRPDSALSRSDLVEIARRLGADYVLEGAFAKASPGIPARLESQLVFRYEAAAIAERVAAVEAASARSAAILIDREIMETLKVMPAVRRCQSALREHRYDDAIKGANAGLTTYPGSLLSRSCLFAAYSATKQLDSIISVGNAILAIDAADVNTMDGVRGAYLAKGDEILAVRMKLRIHRASPTTDVTSVDPRAPTALVDSLFVLLVRLEKAHRTRNHDEAVAVTAALPTLLAAMAAKAVASTSRQDWVNTRNAAALVDSVDSSPVSKFYFGLASFEIGASAIQNAQKLVNERGRACEEIRLAIEMWRAAGPALDVGLRFDRPRAVSALNSIAQSRDELAALEMRHCGTRPFSR